MIILKTIFWETAATALLIASEAFIVGFGAVWVVLTAFAGNIAWEAPAVIGGVALAAWSVVVVFRMAKRAAEQEQGLRAENPDSAA